MSIAKLVNSIFELYWWIIIVRIFLTWIPSLDWRKQPYKFLSDIVDPVLNPFRSLIPSVGGLDFSPIVAIIFIQIVQAATVQLLVHLGL